MVDSIGKMPKNRYKVVKLLRRGGMADMYKVWDEERTVYLAMKVLRDDLANDVVVNQRLKYEVNKLVKFQFLNIALCDDMERKALIQISLCYAIKLGIY